MVGGTTAHDYKATCELKVMKQRATATATPTPKAKAFRGSGERVKVWAARSSILPAHCRSVPHYVLDSAIVVIDGMTIHFFSTFLK